MGNYSTLKTMHFTALPAGVLAIRSMGQMQYKKLQPEVEMSMATRAKLGCFHVYRSFVFFFTVDICKEFGHLLILII